MSGVVVDGVPAGGGVCGATSGTVALVVAELSVLPVVPLAFMELSFDIVPPAFMPPLDVVVPLAELSVLFDAPAVAAGVLPGEESCC